MNKIVQKLRENAQAKQSESTQTSEAHGSGETDQSLENRLSEAEAELKKARRSHHRAGEIDNETLMKAAMYDQMNSGERNSAENGKTEPVEVDGDVQNILNALDEPHKGAIQHQAVEAIKPELEEIRKNQEMLNASIAQQRQVEITKEITDLRNAHPNLENEITAELGQKIKVMIEAGAAESIRDAVEMVLKRSIPLPSDRSERTYAPPPPDTARTSGRDIESVTPQKSSSLMEAMEQAQRDGKKIDWGF